MPGLVTQSQLLTVAVFLLVCSAANASTTHQRSFIASLLFGIPLGSINDSALGANYEYNKWGDSPEDHRNGICDAYDGGHSGIDMQTKDVAAEKTADRIFYSVSTGIVIKAGGDKFNTIAIYDQRQDLTTLYLHSRRVDVKLGMDVHLGQELGIQGDEGVAGSEHVHFEVRAGRKFEHACGASDQDSIDPILTTIGYITGYLGQSLQTDNADGEIKTQLNGLWLGNYIIPGASAAQSLNFTIDFKLGLMEMYENNNGRLATHIAKIVNISESAKGIGFTTTLRKNGRSSKIDHFVILNGSSLTGEWKDGRNVGGINAKFQSPSSLIGQVSHVSKVRAHLKIGISSFYHENGYFALSFDEMGFKDKKWGDYVAKVELHESGKQFSILFSEDANDQLKGHQIHSSVTAEVDKMMWKCFTDIKIQVYGLNGCVRVD